MEKINVVKVTRYAFIASAIIILVSQTGCTANKVGGPDIQISMTAEGARAWGDYQNGMVKTGKEAPDSPNQYAAFRAREEAEITKRENAPSFLGELFGSPGNATRGSATSDD